MPGRSVATNGAWLASTPKSPSAPGTSTCSTSPENSNFSGETRSKWKLAIICSGPVLADRETHTHADHAADQRDDRDMLNLTASQRSIVARDLVALHFDAQRPQLDLRRFRPRHISGQRTDQKPDEQKHNQVGPDRHGATPPPPRASCPFRPPLRWYRPCRRRLPAECRIFPRTDPGSP